MERHDAESHLKYIRNVLAMTQRRIDPHAGHFIIWGTLVLISYPAMNAFCLAGKTKMAGLFGACTLAVGIIGSMAFEAWVKRNRKIDGENTHVANQIAVIVWANLAAAILIGSAGPALGWIHPQSTPIVWGFAYANIGFMLGVVYRSEYRVAGIAIFLATLAAMMWLRYAGFILGPAMGLGMIIPGWMAERRVARLSRES